MSVGWLTAYVLVWPVVAAGVMGVLIAAIVKDWREARRSGEEMV